MITPFPVICEGCQSKVRIRIGIGIDEVQPFSLLCRTCDSPISGELLAFDKNRKPLLKLQMENGIWSNFTDEEAEQVFTIHCDFPSYFNANHQSDLGWSSFMTQSELVGLQSLPEIYEKLGAFERWRKGHWHSIRRFFAFYKKGDLTRFNIEGNKLFDGWRPCNSNEMHTILAESIKTFLIVLEPTTCSLELLEEFDSTILFCRSEFPNKNLFPFLTRKLLMQLLSDLFSRLEFIAGNFAMIRPSYFTFFYQDDVSLNELRVARDDFDVLKSHYLSTFEVLHKILFIPVSLINLVERGSLSSFDDSLSKKSKSMTITNYRKLSSYQKSKYLDSSIFPALIDTWRECLDRPFRNSIGHHSVRHELSTGFLVFDDDTTMPYLEFLRRCMKLNTVLLYGMMVLIKVIAHRDGQ